MEKVNKTSVLLKEGFYLKAPFNQWVFNNTRSLSPLGEWNPRYRGAIPLQ